MSWNYHVIVNGLFLAGKLNNDKLAALFYIIYILLFSYF